MNLLMLSEFLIYALNSAIPPALNLIYQDVGFRNQPEWFQHLHDHDNSDY